MEPYFWISWHIFEMGHKFILIKCSSWFMHYWYSTNHVFLSWLFSYYFWAKIVIYTYSKYLSLRHHFKKKFEIFLASWLTVPCFTVFRIVDRCFQSWPYRSTVNSRYPRSTVLVCRHFTVNHSCISYFNGWPSFFTVYCTLSFGLKVFFWRLFCPSFIISLFQRSLFCALSPLLSHMISPFMPMKIKASKSTTPSSLMNPPSTDEMLVALDSETIH